MHSRILYYCFTALVPLTLLALGLAFDERNEEEDRARTESAAVVNSVRADLDRLFQVSRGLVASLSSDRSLAGEAGICHSLIPLRKSLPEIYNLGFYDLLPGDARGHTVCAVTPATAEPFPLTVNEGPLPESLHNPGEMAFGTIWNNSVTGSLTIPVCGLVQVMPDGARRMFAGSIALEQVRRRLNATPIPGAADLIVLDRNGAVAAVSDSSTEQPGKPAPDFERTLPLHADFVGEVDGSDGVRRFYALAHAGGAGGLSIILKIRASDIFRRSRARLLMHLAGLAAVSALVFGVAWTNSNRYVVRPLARLADVADRLAKGNLSERSGVEYKGEIGRLAHSFDMMAEFLQQDEVRSAQMLEAMRALTARLDSVGEEERTRIAREIHDELGQQLTAMRFELARLDQSLGPSALLISNKVQDLTAMVDAAIRDMRKIATALRPAALDYGGLVDAIRFLGEDFERRTAIPCVVELPEKLCAGDHLATCLFRICQESLTNVARHSGATAVEIRLVADHGSVTLTVHDNGRGFHPEGAGQTTSLGLLGMRERARMAGGILSLISAPGEGTTVLAWIPSTGGAFQK